MPAGSLAARSGHLEPFPFLDSTHDPAVTSWVESANRPDSDFPIQNLPFGVFCGRPASIPCVGSIGVGIGDCILDLRRTARAGLLGGLAPETVAACSATRLNRLMALGRDHWSPLRRRLSDLLQAGSAHRSALAPLLVPMRKAVMRPPADIGDYTD